MEIVLKSMVASSTRSFTQVASSLAQQGRPFSMSMTAHRSQAIARGTSASKSLYSLGTMLDCGSPRFLWLGHRLRRCSWDGTEATVALGALGWLGPAELDATGFARDDLCLPGALLPLVNCHTGLT